MPTTTLVNLFVKIFIMIGFGYGLKKANIIDDRFQKNLSTLLITAILPINILATANSEFKKEFAEKLLQATIISGAYYIFAIIIMTLLCKYVFSKKQRRGIFITMSVFANTAFLGFPLVSELYGAEGTLYAIIYNLCYNIFFFTYGVKILSNDKKIGWKSLLKNVTAIVSLLSILLFISPFRFPEVIVSTFSDIGSMMVPMSMIIIGCGLVKVNLIEILKSKDSYFVSFIRLIAFPLVLFLILRVLQIDRTLASTCVLLTALPAGSLNVIFAEKNNYEPEFATSTVVHSTVLMIVTIPFIMWLLG